MRANSRTRSGFSLWCDTMWNAPVEPLSGYTRFDVSRPSLNENTRVISERNAIICKSIIASRFGKVLVAIRDAESRTRFLGYRVENYKLWVFVFSAVL